MMLYTIFTGTLLCHYSLAKPQGHFQDTIKQKLGAPKNVVNIPLTRPPVDLGSRSASQDYISSSLYAGSPKYTNVELTKIVKKFFDPGQGDLNQVSYSHGALGNTGGSTNYITGQNAVQTNGGNNKNFKKFQPGEQLWIRKKQDKTKQNFKTVEQNNGYRNPNMGNRKDVIETKKNKPVQQTNKIKAKINSVPEQKKNSAYKESEGVSNHLFTNDKPQIANQKLTTGVSKGRGPATSQLDRNRQSQRKGPSQNKGKPNTNVKTNPIQSRKTKLEARLKKQLQKMMNRIKQMKKRRRQNRMRNRKNRNRQNTKLDNQNLAKLYWLMNSFAED